MDLSSFKNLTKLLPELEVIDKMYKAATDNDDMDWIVSCENNLSRKMANAFYEDTKDFNSKPNVDLLFIGVAPWMAIKRLRGDFEYKICEDCGNEIINNSCAACDHELFLCEQEHKKTKLITEEA